MAKDSIVVILSFASAFTEARWFPNVLGSIVLDKPLNELFRIIVVQEARSGVFAADTNNFLHDLRNPSGSGKNTNQASFVVSNCPSVPVRPPAKTTMSHDRIYVISRPVRPLPV